MLRKMIGALLITASLSLCVMTAPPPQAAGGQAATFDERLGEDDGAALAILISANERGNIEVCD
ncbi:MAG TPA: hypothetical protein VNI02_24125 [Blastocatellia bacterium]|nr:hypothetical protein [Blastocatellia bacterium]